MTVEKAYVYEPDLPEIKISEPKVPEPKVVEPKVPEPKVVESKIKVPSTFVPNDNGYPTLIYHKNLGVPGYKQVNNVEEHWALMNKLEPETPKMGRPKKNLKFDIED